MLQCSWSCWTIPYYSSTLKTYFSSSSEQFLEQKSQLIGCSIVISTRDGVDAHCLGSLAFALHLLNCLGLHSVVPREFCHLGESSRFMSCFFEVVARAWVFETAGFCAVDGDGHFGSILGTVWNFECPNLQVTNTWNCRFGSVECTQLSMERHHQNWGCFVCSEGVLCLGLGLRWWVECVIAKRPEDVTCILHLLYCYIHTMLVATLTRHDMYNGSKLQSVYTLISCTYQKFRCFLCVSPGIFFAGAIFWWRWTWGGTSYWTDRKP